MTPITFLRIAQDIGQNHTEYHTLGLMLDGDHVLDVTSWAWLNEGKDGQLDSTLKVHCPDDAVMYIDISKIIAVVVIERPTAQMRKSKAKNKK